MAFEEIGLEAVLRNVGGYVGDASKMVAANKAITGSLDRAVGAANRFRDTAGKAIRRGALIAGAAVAAMGVAAVKMGTDFQTAFTEVTTLFDASEEQIASLQKGVLQLSKDMGIDATEATRALYQAISAGVAPENALTFLRENVKLAVGGVTDLATAVDLTTTVLNAFGLQGQELTRVMDTMFLAVVQGKTTIAELGASMFNVAGAAAAADVSVEETAAALATLAAAGTPTAVATTALRAAFIELGKEGTKANKAFQEIAGVGFRQFEQEGGNVVEAMDLLRQKAEEDGVAVSDLFGSMEAGVEIGKLAGVQFEALSANFEGMSNKAGKTQTAFEKMNATFGRQFAILKENIKVPLVELGLVILPALTRAAQKLGEELPKAIEAAKRVFQDWQPALEESARLLGNVADAVIRFGGWIIANQGALVTAIVAIGVAFLWVSPITAALVGAGGLIIALGLTRTATEELGETALRVKLKVLEMKQGFLDAALDLSTLFTRDLPGVGPIIDSFLDKTSKMKESLNKVNEEIEETKAQLRGFEREAANADLRARALALGFSESEAAAADAGGMFAFVERAILRANVAMIEAGSLAPTVAQAYRIIALAAAEAGESVELFGTKLIISLKEAELVAAFVAGAPAARLRTMIAEIEGLQAQLAGLVVPIPGVGPPPGGGAAAPAAAPAPAAAAPGIEDAVEEMVDVAAEAWRRGAEEWMEALAQGIRDGTLDVANAIEFLESGMLDAARNIVDALLVEQVKIQQQWQILADIISQGFVTLADAARLFELGATEAALAVLQTLVGEPTALAEVIERARREALAPIFPTLSAQQGAFIPAGRTVQAQLHGPEVVMPLGRGMDFSRLEQILSGISGGGAFRNYGSVNLFAESGQDGQLMRSMTRALGVT